MGYGFGHLLGVGILRFEFWVSASVRTLHASGGGLRAWDLWFGVADIKVQLSGFWNLVSDFGFQEYVFRSQFSGLGSQISGSGSWISG